MLSSGCRFSIVICNRNYERWLPEAVASALMQAPGAPDFEVIVVDDGSTDGSREVLRRLTTDGLTKTAAQINIFEQPHSGQAAAFYRGVLAAQGEYVCLLDSDDLFDPHKLATLDAVLADFPGTQFLIHNVRVIGDDPQEILIGALLDDLTGEDSRLVRLVDQPGKLTFPVPCGVVLSRALACDVLDAMPRDDWWQGADGTINLAAWLMCGEVLLVPQVLSSYRVHGANHFAHIRDGRLLPNVRVQRRIPKRLMFCERLLDEIELAPMHRKAAQAVLSSLSRASRLGATSPLPACFPPCQTIAIAADEAAWPVVAKAFSGSRAELLRFLRDGEQTHPWLEERTGYAHLSQRALVVGCDFSVASQDGVRLREHVLLAAGLVPSAGRQWAPFPILRPWPLGPLGTLSFRNTPVVRAWVSHCDRRASRNARRFPSVLVAGGLWALGGAALLGEALLVKPVADLDEVLGVGAGEALADDPGTPVAEAFAWLDLPMLLLGFIIEAEPALLARIPPSWIAALTHWAKDLLPAPLRSNLGVAATQRKMHSIARVLLATGV